MDRAYRQLALIATVQVCVMATWFSASAVVGDLKSLWDVGSAGAALLTASVQLGFVTGAVTSAVLNLADVVPTHRLVAACGLAAAATTVLVATVASTLAVGVLLRFLTGVALAGVYPPGMKLMATWFRRGRGFAIAVLVAALTVGSALPHLVNGLGSLPWRGVLLTASGLAVAGSLVAAAAVRPGPYGAASPPFNPRYLLEPFRERAPRLANLGYFGHMWELYAVWTWLPAFLAAAVLRAGADLPGGLDPELAAFACIGGAGLVGCLIGGLLGDRVGRARVAAGAMWVSGACCLVAAGSFGRAPALLLVVCLVWGAAVIADSAMFSASLADSVDPRYLGTALTTQTAIGFTLTVVSIQGLPQVVDVAGWRVAVALLAVGPLAGAFAMRALAAGQSADEGSTAP
ncbi:MFS transporter [Spongisporangium articulatum]|uniref:MFS transporter n=1 Tax=Spongisporangium articulatum TaxID=3362603 RepID=A0ABW8ANV8_9ACTN